MSADENDLSKLEHTRISRSKTQKKKWGFSILGLTFLYVLICIFFLEPGTNFPEWNVVHRFTCIIMFLVSMALIFNFKQILFDPKEYTPNRSRDELVKKFRYRGVLFNNIAIILFLITIAVIISCFYILISPVNTTGESAGNIWVNALTVRLAVSILLIFLVQILFKVFKYLIRVAAFYNARADAMEFITIENTIGLDKLMDLFTPEKYDITELDRTGMFDAIIENLKPGK
jgi:hypothetical protein